VSDDPDFWYTVSHSSGRISKCYNWFQAYNELAEPGAVGTIKHHGHVIASRHTDGKWMWAARFWEPGLDVEVE
jgi:hypothetical protein